VGYKIREGELEKVPYLLVVGDQEVESRTVRVRRRGYGDQGVARLEDFASMIKDEIARKAR
jgi:threonyl-tRNA synthetase